MTEQPPAGPLSPSPVAAQALLATPTLEVPLPAAKPISERAVVFLVGAIQFVNILDFMMVMPLGPDFAAALGIPTSQIGVVGGSYTAAAAVAGLGGSLFLDRFDRRKALAVTIFGLVVSTALGGLATGIGTLIGARVLAGAFGGPATSLALAVVIDCVPPARRGKALGAVMGAFSVASVLGVPAGLELAERFGWRAPFLAVAALGLLVCAAALFVMPPMKEHLARATPSQPKGKLLDGVTLLALANAAVLMMGMFAVVPNISTFVQHNLGYPRGQLGTLYLVGGAASFVTLRFAGGFVDRLGATPVIVVGTLLHGAALVLGFVAHVPWLPVLLIFTLFMLSASVRMVPMQTLATRVPRPEQRARFMSAQSSVQHFASAAGATASSVILVAQPSGTLEHMDTVALMALALACLLPFGVAALERRVRRREAEGQEQ